jgi:hypothetical protein
LKKFPTDYSIKKMHAKIDSYSRTRGKTTLMRTPNNMPNWEFGYNKNSSCLEIPSDEHTTTCGIDESNI